jgi:hypothetical protein
MRCQYTKWRKILARFVFLDNGYVGRLGNTVGAYDADGQLYIKRYRPATNPNTEGQQEIRALFGELNHIGKQLRPMLALINRPKLPKHKLVQHFVHLNKVMFNGKSRTAKASGGYTRWDPKRLQLCSGTLPAITMKPATLQKQTLTISVNWEAPKNVVAGNECLIVVYDEDSQNVITATKDVTVGVENITASAFEGITTWANIHVFIVYFNGTLKEGELVSRTAYTKVPAPPTPSSEPASSTTQEQATPQPETPDEQATTPENKGKKTDKKA